MTDMIARSAWYLAHQRLLLGALTLSGFAFLFLAGKLFGNDGIEYLIDHETLHTTGHIFVYGALAVMLARAMGDRYLLAWVASNLLAAGEEYHQLVVPGRVASLEDAAINFVSISAFLLLAVLARGVLHRRRSRHATTPPQAPQPGLARATHRLDVLDDRLPAPKAAILLVGQTSHGATSHETQGGMDLLLDDSHVLAGWRVRVLKP